MHAPGPEPQGAWPGTAGDTPPGQTSGVCSRQLLSDHLAFAGLLVYEGFESLNAYEQRSGQNCRSWPAPVHAVLALFSNQKRLKLPALAGPKDASKHGASTAKPRLRKPHQHVKQVFWASAGPCFLVNQQAGVQIPVPHPRGLIQDMPAAATEHGATKLLAMVRPTPVCSAMLICCQRAAATLLASACPALAANALTTPTAA